MININLVILEKFSGNLEILHQEENLLSRSYKQCCRIAMAERNHSRNLIFHLSRFLPLCCSVSVWILMSVEEVKRVENLGI